MTSFGVTRESRWRTPSPPSNRLVEPVSPLTDNGSNVLNPVQASNGILSAGGNGRRLSRTKDNVQPRSRGCNGVSLSQPTLVGRGPGNYLDPRQSGEDRSTVAMDAFSTIALTASANPQHNDLRPEVVVHQRPWKRAKTQSMEEQPSGPHTSYTGGPLSARADQTEPRTQNGVARELETHAAAPAISTDDAELLLDVSRAMKTSPTQGRFKMAYSMHEPNDQGKATPQTRSTSEPFISQSLPATNGSEVVRPRASSPRQRIEGHPSSNPSVWHSTRPVPDPIAMDDDALRTRQRGLSHGHVLPLAYQQSSAASSKSDLSAIWLSHHVHSTGRGRFSVSEVTSVGHSTNATTHHTLQLQNGRTDQHNGQRLETTTAGIPVATTKRYKRPPKDQPSSPSNRRIVNRNMITDHLDDRDRRMEPDIVPSNPSDPSAIPGTAPARTVVRRSRSHAFRFRSKKRIGSRGHVHADASTGGALPNHASYRLRRTRSAPCLTQGDEAGGDATNGIDLGIWASGTELASASPVRPTASALDEGQQLQPAPEVKLAGQESICADCHMRTRSSMAANNEDESWISCDRCHRWLHFACAGLTEEEVRTVDKFSCRECWDTHGPTTCKILPPPPNHRLDLISA